MKKVFNATISYAVMFVIGCYANNEFMIFNEPVSWLNWLISILWFLYFVGKTFEDKDQ